MGSSPSEVLLFQDGCRGSASPTTLQECSDLMPSDFHPELWVYWQYFAKDFVCVLGRPEMGGDLDKDDFTKLWALALVQDDYYVFAEVEKALSEGAEKRWPH